VEISESPSLAASAVDVTDVGVEVGCCLKDDVAAEFLVEKYRRPHSAKPCSDPSEPHTREIYPDFSPKRRMAVFVFASDPGAGLISSR
jgi:hypothetical protein